MAFERAATALTLGEYDVARKLVDAFPDLSDSSQPLATVDGLLLAAWLAESHGSLDWARRQLTKAMAVAESHSLVESFVHLGPAILRMVRELPGSRFCFSRAGHPTGPGIHFALAGKRARRGVDGRELEILSYLPSRLTNTELADQFYVSVNTIKTHMAHIYRKLGAANRNSAISRAQEIGIL